MSKSKRSKAVASKRASTPRASSMALTKRVTDPAAPPPKPGLYGSDPDAILENYMRRKDVPDWFRGSSTYQIKAINRLGHAMRDDSEQNTVNRVTACLKAIGLHPLITGRAIKTLMRLSRCYDIAFLWFLMEMYYKTDGDHYTLNEQLLLSAIAHLDMFITIRELDRLLPPPLKKSPRVVTKTCRVMRPDRIQFTNCKLPYFQALPRPCRYGKSLKLRRPDFQVKVKNYEKYHDEDNRWFATYELQTGKRVVKHLLNAEVEKVKSEKDAVGQEHEGATLEMEHIIYKEVDRAIEAAECPAEKDTRPKGPPLCVHHRIELEAETKLRNEMAVMARDRCLRLVDVDRRRREATRQRVLDGLEKDIEVFMCKYRRLRTAADKAVPVRFLVSDACHQCSIEVVEEACDSSNLDCRCYGEEDTGAAEESASSGNRGYGQPNPPTEPMPVRRLLCPREPGIFLCYDGKDATGYRSSSEERPVGDYKPHRASGGSIRSKRGSDANGSQNSVHFKPPSEIPPSQHYFHAVKENLPYHFDLKKIFSQPDKSEALDVRRTFVENLDETAKDVATRANVPVDVQKACSNMVMELWRKNVEAKCKEMEAEELTRRLSEPPPYIFPVAAYDPQDTKQMDLMLLTCMERMREDQRFVLASLPDAYKMPFLREWIYLRYGKKYTAKQRFTEFSETIHIFHSVRRAKLLNITLPSIAKYADRELDYSCREYYHEIGQRLKRKYTSKVDKAILNHARVYWFAMRPYLWPRGPPRQTYFAYMPARIDDIIKFRLWKPSELMNAKDAWDKRMSLKRAERSY